MFYKQYYSIYEALDLINEYLSVNRISIDYFHEKIFSNDIPLFVRFQRITKEGYSFFNYNKDNHFDEKSDLHIFKNDSLSEEKYPLGADIRTLNNDTIITVYEYPNNWLGRGYFELSINALYEDRINTRQVRLTKNIQVDDYPNTGDDCSVFINFHNLVEINFDHIFIPRENIKYLISSLMDHESILMNKMELLEAIESIEDIELYLNQANARIKELEAEIENLKKTGTEQANQSEEYNGEIPPKTARDKLRDFIELIASDEFIENGKLISYSRIYTKLTNKHRDKQIPAKNTIGKYINEVQ